MVAVRRVKLLVVFILAFVGFMGLYQLEKRRQLLRNSGLFSDGNSKISGQRQRPVTPATSSVTRRHAVTVERITTDAQRVLPTTLKVSNINPEEEEEELVNNEIEDTLEWVKQMRHQDDQDVVTALRDIFPTINDKRDAVNDVATEEENSNLGYAPNEVFPKVNYGQDSNKHDVDLRAAAVAASAVGITAATTTAKEEETAAPEATTTAEEEEEEETVATTLPDATSTAVKRKVATTTAEEEEETVATPPPDATATAVKTTVATTTAEEEEEETVATPPPDATATADKTTVATTTAEKLTTATQKETIAAVSILLATPTTTVKTKSPPNGTSMYTPSPMPRVNACNLPKLNPWDSSIRHLLNDVGFDPNCKSKNPRSLYTVVGNRLVLRDNSSLSGTRINSFSLETIHRTKDSDNDFDIHSEVSPINVSTNEVYKSRKMLTSDFFRISYQQEGKAKETHYFAQIVPRQDIIKKSEEIRQSSSLFKKSLPLNVLILALDSTSNANFLRKMPHTLKWLRTQMRSYIMRGYSIVGDATTPALTALLTGNHAYDLPEGRRGYEGSEPIDRWPWISKQYESQGYVTLYAEDDPPMSTFNLRLNGFVTPPYHHFMRPFWLAIESEGLRDEPGICSRDMSLANYTMEYLLSFFEAYEDTPKFAMGFLSYLTHAHPNHLSYGDFDVLYLLSEMKSRGFLDNTLLVILGDHGSRNDDVRSTMQGKLEERLPWLSISVPDWLESRYPEMTAALANNENIISSPFDLHITLQHILTYPDTPVNTKTYRSLLTNMSRDRACKDAGIDEHWCPCLQFKPMEVANQDVQQAALAVVNHINKLLNSTDTLRMSCNVIKLNAVHNAMQYEPNEKVQRFSFTNQDTDQEVKFGTRTRDGQHFLVTIETSPMDALFEATVTMADDKSVVVNPNISRINLYGNQPICIAKKYPYLRKYCVCKN